MHHRSPLGAVALAMTLCATVTAARAWDDAKYPDWKGQWERVGGGSFDTDKRPGRAQQPPLNAEYMAVWETNMKDEATGGQSYNTQVRCLPGGMPRMMIAYQPMEVIVSPDITYIAISFFGERRRIYTDGRDWPAEIDPSYQGYSIGKWIDEDGDGKYDVLEIETRGPFKGPRSFDATGLPLHYDNQSVFKERMWRDKADPRFLHDQITVVDHALTRPWISEKKYVHNPNPRPRWGENNCMESNNLVAVGREMYAISGDGYLMPVKKDQEPPDLRYFKRK
jgi:hypothetical protein